MSINDILAEFATLIGIAVTISVVSKALNDGLIGAWKIESGWIKRIVVFAVNALMVYDIAFMGIELPIMRFIFLLLLVCSGAETCYRIINTLNDVRGNQD